jgi:hypothetical protein
MNTLGCEIVSPTLQKWDNAVSRIRDAYPGSRILNSEFLPILDPGSRILDPKTSTKKRGEEKN